MKKIIIISISIIVIFIIIAFVTLPKFKNNDNNLNENTEISLNETTYIVKNFNGKIAVFENGNHKPFKITDVPVNSLPYTDQEVLKQGVAVKSKTDLNKLLEDYCS